MEKNIFNFAMLFGLIITLTFFLNLNLILNLRLPAGRQAFVRYE